MALNGLFCADVPLRNYSLTHSRCCLTFSGLWGPFLGRRGSCSTENAEHMVKSASDW